MKVTIIDKKDKKQFKDLNIGDAFMIEGSYPCDTVYIKMAEITTSKEKIKMNCFVVNKGLFTFMSEDKLVIVPKEASITITI